MLRLSVSAGLVLALLANQACTSDGPEAEEAVVQDGSEEAADAADASQEAKPESADEAATAAPADVPAGDEASAPTAASESMSEGPTNAAEAPAVAPAAALFTVSASALNVRSGPGMRHKIVRVLKHGAQVQELDRSKRWIKIGEGEYVAASYLRAVEGVSSPKAEAAPAAAPVEELEPALPSQDDASAAVDSAMVEASAVSAVEEEAEVSEATESANPAPRAFSNSGEDVEEAPSEE